MGVAVIRHAAMRRFILASLALLTPALLGTDLVVETPRVPGRSPIFEEENLRRFNHQLDGVLDSQVEELILLSPREARESIRREYDDWKLERDTNCSSAPSPGTEGESERECRSILGEKRYQELEVKIVTAEEEKSTR